MTFRNSHLDPQGSPLERYGGYVARQLLGTPEGGVEDWRVYLQQAADVSQQDPEVLRVCDELFASGSDLRTTMAIRAYAESTALTVTHAPATTFLHGMRNAF